MRRLDNLTRTVIHSRIGSAHGIAVNHRNIKVNTGRENAHSVAASAVLLLVRVILHSRQTEETCVL
jgi:hypothetical protein